MLQATGDFTSTVESSPWMLEVISSCINNRNFAAPELVSSQCNSHLPVGVFALLTSMFASKFPLHFAGSEPAHMGMSLRDSSSLRETLRANVICPATSYLLGWLVGLLDRLGETERRT